MKIGGYETHPAADLFPMLDDAAIRRLADDIKANGQKVPVVLLDGKILDGRNRVAACKLLGHEPRTVEHNGANPWRAVWSLNAERRQIEDKLRLALIGKRMVAGSDAWEAKQAKAKEEASSGRARAAEERRGVGGKLTSRASREARQAPKPRGDETRKTAARLAAEVGVSRATVERALELERKRPEAAAAVARGEVVGARALRDAKREERVERLMEVAKGNTPLTGALGRFPVIYADPPWRYDNVPETESRFIEEQYPTMSIEDICALPVKDIATPDAVLFLWATSPLLPYAMRVIEAWGFSYKTSAVWVKDRIGMGYFFRQRHELLLVATRGSPPTPLPGDRPDSVIEAALGKHSSKPDAVAARIERMYPGLPRVELFARSLREGWSAWGNQAGKAG